ncbi:MAG TPA: ImmA/IrrE family metallo-endopeptidase [Firmicutes bacterium]|nr:ImmA/IrrE family metallo-endopeptidase [Bacillota bacterium]
MQKILEIVQAEQIYVAYEYLQQIGDVQGLYTVNPLAGAIIVLDTSLLTMPKQHRCVAAHELGHHFHPPRSNIAGIVSFYRSNNYSNSQNELIIHQDENKALRWATELLMPSVEVWEAIKDGCDTVPLLSEQFYVPEWFTRAKIGYIRREERDRGTGLGGGELLKGEDCLSWTLGADNPKHAPMVLKGTGVRIIGRVMDVKFKS